MRPGLPVSQPERVTHDARWALQPRPSADGRWLAYTRSDGRSDIQMQLRDQQTGEVRSLGRTNGLATFDWIGSDRLLISQDEFQDPYRIYSDLYVLGLDGGQTRLTEGRRLGQPSVAADGTWAVAIQDGGGTNAVVRVDLASGAVTVLVSPDPDVHWAFPRLSPDGRWIAATRWEPEAYHDVVVLDASSGRIVQRVTRDRALDLAPSWSPDGRWIVWTSDRDGIFNVLTASVDPSTGTAGEVRAASNVRTGAAYPAVDPAGDAVWFSGYHVDGWDVERLAFDPASAPPAGPAVARFTQDEAPPIRGQSTEPVQDYSAASTLLPTYWEINYRDPVVTPERSGDDFLLRSREVLGAGLGIQTSGRDLVGRHAWSALGRVFTSGGRFEGGASYSWAGLGNPVLTLSANQRWNDGGQGLAGGTAEDTVFILERDRSLDAGVTFRAPSYRRDLRFTLSGGLIWERLELLGRDLEPTSEYRLSRPSGRLSDLGLSVTWNSSRTHSFQMGTARGVSIFVQGRRVGEFSLPDSLAGVEGEDRTVNEVYGAHHACPGRAGDRRAGVRARSRCAPLPGGRCLRPAGAPHGSRTLRRQLHLPSRTRVCDFRSFRQHRVDDDGGVSVPPVAPQSGRACVAAPLRADHRCGVLRRRECVGTERRPEWLCQRDADAARFGGRRNHDGDPRSL